MRLDESTTNLKVNHGEHCSVNTGDGSWNWLLGHRSHAGNPINWSRRAFGVSIRKSVVDRYDVLRMALGVEAHLQTTMVPGCFEVSQNQITNSRKWVIFFRNNMNAAPCSSRFFHFMVVWGLV